MPSIDTLVTELIRKHMLSAEQFTEAQLAEAICQAIASGDFTRCVTADRADPQQQVVYEPFREVVRLRTLYNELLYAVARKFEGETRHETALRYIRQAEVAVLENRPVENFLEPELTNK